MKERVAIFFLQIIFRLVVARNIRRHHGDTSFVERSLMDAGFIRSLENGDRVYRSSYGPVIYRVKSAR